MTGWQARAARSGKARTGETPPFDLVLSADRAVIAGEIRPAAVAVRDGMIADIGPAGATWPSAREIRLAKDDVLLPGMVDTHVHVNEPGRTDWEGFASATRAALRGGATTIIDMPLNSLPPTTTVAALETKRAAAQGQCYVDVGFWGGAVPGNIEDLLPLHDEGVFGLKCFLIDSGMAEFPPLSPVELGADMRRLALLGALLIAHAEDAATRAGVAGRAGTGPRRWCVGRVRSRASPGRWGVRRCG